MEKTYKALKRYANLLKNLTDAITIILLMAMVATMFSQVVGRFVFGKSIIWAEEALRFMLIWLVFLGVSTAIHDNELSRFEMLLIKLSKFGQKLVWTMIYALMGIVLYFTVVGVLPLIQKQLSQVAVAVPISMGVVYMVIPYYAVVSIFYLLLHLVAVWFGYPELSFDEEGLS